MIRIAIAFAAALVVAYCITHPQTVHNVNAAQEVQPW